MKLARKLALFLLLGMFVVLVTDATIGILQEERLLTNDMRADEYQTGRALALAAADLWRLGQQERAKRLVTDANASTASKFVRWVDLSPTAHPDDAPRVHSDSLRLVRSGRSIGAIREEPSGARSFYTYVPVVVDGTAVGAVEISESLDTQERHIDRILLRRTLSTLAIILLSAVLAVVLGATFVGRPVQALVEKARRVGEGDLTGPLALTQRDEIGELAREINAMCERLQTAQDRIETEMSARIAANDQLRHADRLATVGKLASGIAHELGTPLNVVSQRAKMIAVGEVADGEARESARIVVEQSERIAGVIRQLLDFARRHAPRTAVQDIRPLVEQTFRLLTPLAQRARVDMHMDSADGPVLAAVDGGQIQQVLTNLVINGIQAMPDGGTIGIALGHRAARPPADHAGSEGDYVFVDVSDAGEGIREHDRMRIFEPFFTTKDVGEGTGLGLAVAYGIVQEHGGWIEVRSSTQKGSVFSLYLPPARVA